MDRPEDHGDIARLARQIADGERVDWERECLDGSITPEQVRHLRLVERISDEHRRVLDEDDLPFTTWGPLDLKQSIASGGFGDVFLACDRNLQRDVALKLFVENEDGSGRETFAAEARRLATVRHANVVAIHGVDRHQGRTGLWMDWIDGETLEALVDDQGAYAADEAARIGIELCRALAAIHGAGLVHRDVKLSNVMRERGGRIVLMDFGSSTHVADGRGPSIGTPIYLAPEVFEGGDSGLKVDIYSLGVLLYRLTSDGFPLEFGTAVEMRRAHREGKLVSLRDRNPHLPPAFVEVVERAMNPDPERRYASAGEMERALAESIRVQGDSRRGPLRWGRAPLWAAMLVVGVLAAVVGTSLLRAPFAPEASFQLHTKDGPVQLVSGDRVAPGDKISLKFETNRPSWVYVINADATGRQLLLFPVAGLEIDNPLPPGSHRFPGEIDGVNQAWDVTSAGGQELLLVVASTRPLEIVEEHLPDLQAVAPGSPLILADPETTTKLRGIGGISPAPEEKSPIRPSVVGEITMRLGEGDGVRVWELLLPNPEGDVRFAAPVR